MSSGIDISRSARQRLAVYALQRVRRQYVADVSLYARHSLLFIDETGTD